MSDDKDHCPHWVLAAGLARELGLEGTRRVAAMSLEFLRYAGIPKDELDAFAKDCVGIIDFVKTNAKPEPEMVIQLADPVTPGCSCENCQQKRKELS